MSAPRKSPFPGCDPYLQQTWGDAHTRFVTYLSDMMLGRLPQGLRARIEESVTLEETNAEGWSEPPVTYRPDAMLTESPESSYNWRGGGYEVRNYDPNADQESGDLLTVLYDQDPPVDRFIEIRDTQRGNRVITTIEILSPSNKTLDGAKGFRKKQGNLRCAGVSLVEIDLIRGGGHALFPPEDMIKKSPAQNFHICVTAAWWHRKSMLHRIRLQHHLPEILVPLRPGEPMLPLNLQELHDLVYDRGDYGADIDYGKEPVPPLSKEDAVWADEWLRSKGLRV